MGYQLLCIDDDRYPECLRNIYAPPAVLYIDGNMPDVDNVLTIAVVGTRTASNYGISNSYKIGYSLSKYGVYTVSGGALGVDCASHRGTLAAGGVTVCVLGCGINYRYLMENAADELNFFNSFVDKGLLEQIIFDGRETNISIPENEIAIWKKASGIL